MTYSEIETLIVENLASGIKIPAIDHREVEMALLNYINDNLPKQFDVKWIYATTQYLGDNFEPNGLGKNLRAGWALMNGNNGTPPDCGGRMFINYGGDFTTLNAIGGSKDAVVIAHGHETNTNIDFGSGDGVVRQRARSQVQGVGNIIGVNTVGEDGTGKNMPPYMTLIAIMKL
jgi:hypothetical protein